MIKVTIDTTAMKANAAKFRGYFHRDTSAKNKGKGKAGDAQMTAYYRGYEQGLATGADWIANHTSMVYQRTGVHCEHAVLRTLATRLATAVDSGDSARVHSVLTMSVDALLEAMKADASSKQ